MGPPIATPRTVRNQKSAAAAAAMAAAAAPAAIPPATAAAAATTRRAIRATGLASVRRRCLPVSISTGAHLPPPTARSLLCRSMGCLGKRARAALVAVFGLWRTPSCCRQRRGPCRAGGDSGVSGPDAPHQRPPEPAFADGLSDPAAGPGPAQSRAAAGAGPARPTAGRARARSPAGRAESLRRRSTRPEAAAGWACNVSEVGHFVDAGRIPRLALRGSGGAQLRLLRHLHRLAAERGQPRRRAVTGRRRPRHVGPRASGADGNPHRPADARPARVAQPELQARPARRRDRQRPQPAGPDVDLRRQPGLPAPDPRCDRGGVPVRARERLLARTATPSGSAAARGSLRSTSATRPAPAPLWEGNVFAHGLNVSDDGNTLYDSDPIDGKLTLLDVTQVQHRFPEPQVTEISSLTWNTVSVPQNTIPVTIARPPLPDRVRRVRVPLQPGDGQRPGRRRPDHRHRRSGAPAGRLQPPPRRQPARRHTRPPTATPRPLPAPAFNYAAHYCGVPRQVDPEIVACSFINSGLRVFNIQDPLHPREVAYFISPPKQGTLGGLDAGDFAMSQPAFDPGPAGGLVHGRDARASTRCASTMAPGPDPGEPPHRPPATGTTAAQPQAAAPSLQEVAPPAQRRGHAAKRNASLQAKAARSRPRETRRTPRCRCPGRSGTSSRRPPAPSPAGRSCRACRPGCRCAWTRVASRVAGTTGEPCSSWPWWERMMWRIAWARSGSKLSIPSISRRTL